MAKMFDLKERDEGREKQKELEEHGERMAIEEYEKKRMRAGFFARPAALFIKSAQNKMLGAAPGEEEERKDQNVEANHSSGINFGQEVADEKS